MERIKSFLSQKRYGFYVTLCVSILAIVAAIVYAANYHDYLAMMSWPAFILLLVLACLSIALTFLKWTAPWAQIPVAIGSLVALLLFIQAMYNYVVVVMVGIDLAGFSPQFITCSVLFGLTFVAAVANIFFGQVKEEKEQDKVEVKA